MSAAVPLLQRIENFRAAQRRIIAELPDEFEAEAQFITDVLDPPTDALRKLCGPAADHREVLEALRLADEIARDNDYTKSLASPLVEAAIGYLDKTSELLSTDLSPELGLAASAIAVFRNRLHELQCERFDVEKRLKGCDAGLWHSKPEGRLRDVLCEQEEAFAAVRFALEDFIRVRTCGTIGDLIHKLAQDETRLMREPLHQDDTADDARQNAELLKSILPWMQKVAVLGSQFKEAEVCRPPV